MSATSPCVPCCSSTTETVNVPGTTGINAYTTTTADFTVPADEATVTVSVGTTAWMAVGQKLFISDGTDYGYFEVQSIGGPATVTVVFKGYTDDAAPGAVIGSGAKVSPGGTENAFTTTALKALNTTLLSGEAAFTDNSDGTSSDTIAAGSAVITWTFTHTMAAGTSAGECITEITPGYAFKILSWQFVTDVPGVGAGASRVFNMEIGSTDVGSSASTITLTEASTSSKGEVTSGTAVSGNDDGNSTDTFSIEVANGGTAFSAGSGTFIIKVRNMDLANAIASLADKINDTLAALQT